MTVGKIASCLTAAAVAVVGTGAVALAGRALDKGAGLACALARAAAIPGTIVEAWRSVDIEQRPALVLRAMAEEAGGTAVGEGSGGSEEG